jgi:FixJ family two-component response regulator
MPQQFDLEAVVHIVDDDASMRNALQDLLQSIGLEARVYATGREFLTVSDVASPGCLIVDIRLPDVNGLDFQEQLAKRNVLLPVVFMSSYGDIPMTVRAMKKGAIDFLPKPFKDQDMIDAVLAAIERDRQRRTSEQDAAGLRRRFESLSSREQQVMQLVAAGRMNKQIAGELGLSEITIKAHRGSVMRKMEARSLADLIRMADTINPNRT